ncbi:MAG: TIGR01212 family radical SAM protein [Thermoguttaceae bacterium]
MQKFFTDSDHQSQSRPATVYSANVAYTALGPALRAEFGESIWKVSVDAHLHCPHQDSTGKKGCIFCNAHSFSPSRVQGLESITEQISEGIRRLQHRYNARKFIAYFQPSTNTFGPIQQLEQFYREALAQPQIIGLAIGTRPDCVSDSVLDLLETLSKETWVLLELGVQSIHEKSLQFLNRGHDFACFLDTVQRARTRNLRLGVHLILDIPGETAEDRLETAKTIARLPIHTVKLHNLYVVRNTVLAELWQSGCFQLPSCEEYADYVVDFLEQIPPEMVVDRLYSAATSDFLLAPDWTAHPHVAKKIILERFQERKTRQGAKYGG